MDISLGVVKLPLIALSLFLIVLTIYTVIDISGRLLGTNSRSARFLWYIGGTLTGGTGIATHHFIGFLAYHTGSPQQYDLKMVAGSLFISYLTTSSILLSVLLPLSRTKRILLGSSAAALGYTFAHILAMKTVDAAMRVTSLHLALWLGSCVAIAFVCLHFMLYQTNETLYVSVRKKALGSLLVGIAITVQQFIEWETGMLPTSHGQLEANAAGTIGQNEFLEVASGITVMILILNLLSAYMDRRRAVRIARYKNTQYESLFQHNPNLVSLFDLEGRLLSANPALEAITGFRLEELQYRSYKEMIFSEYADLIEDKLHQIKSGDTIRFELSTRHKQGHRLELDVTSVPVIIDEQVSAIYAIAEDITVRKQIEEALRQSEAKYKFIAENMSDLICIYGINGGIQYASPSHMSILQLPVEAYIDNNVKQFIHPDDLGVVLESHQLLVQTKKPQQYEFRIKRGDGEWILLEAKAIPILEANDQIANVAVIARDVTKRKQAERQLEESEQRYRSLFAHNPDAVFSIDARGMVTSINPAVQTILGYNPGDIIDKPFYSFISEEEQLKTLRYLRWVRKGATQNFEVKVTHKDGHLVMLHVNLVPIIIDEATVGYFGIAKDVTERRRAEETIHHLAFHDALTDLPNRRLFKERLAAQLQKGQSTGKQLCVMFLDLDRFKIMNDTLGHDVGDRLLVRVAQDLQEILRSEDTLARMGGDEFTILLPEIDGEETAVKVAEDILQVFAKPFAIGEHHLHITTSIGIAITPKDGTDVDTLMKNADMAMYRAKEQGKNRYQLFADVGQAGGISALMLENQLHQALEHDQFVLHYQPQVDTKTGSIIGMEALIRWEHPELGLLTPKAFIQLAEETGMILDINKWALREACRQCSVWRKSFHPALRIAVNLATRNFQQNDFEKQVEEILQETELPAEALVLEIKESTAMVDAKLVMQKLKTLKRLGVQISIDDFGTGFSSLSLLRKYPIDLLKIDASFVRELTVSPDSEAIVQAIISLANSLKREVMAEGVETSKQLELLEELGCSQAQGYLFSHPLPGEAAEQLLSEVPSGWGRIHI
ncbi:EAL domain-containing protein [Brevibacillus migulae]|uniref:EAL domain-containing protein n=1 Tax=Brevibacillus migulae TaxID=1644114 RepID=UPI0014308324|nr:EAL domain-containing protein [Brevibacillus migulae]